MLDGTKARKGEQHSRMQSDRNGYAPKQRPALRVLAEQRGRTMR
jgi:hypothetical protein